MAQPMKPEDLARLQAFVQQCKETPQVLAIPQLKFFRDFVESLGGTIPFTDAPSEKMEEESSSTKAEPEAEAQPEAAVESSEESDVEIDNEGILAAEDIPFPPMGDSTRKVSEDDETQAGEFRSQAMASMCDDLSKAIELMTKAIELTPGYAALYAKRASMLLKQKRVMAALADCNEAIKLNPDSAPAYKFRGRAQRLLGNWIEAAKDLRVACKLDFEEQAHEWLQEVASNAAKLEEHQRKYERKREDKLISEKRERIRKANEAAKKEQEKQRQSGGMPSGMPGGMPGGMGGVFGDLFNDPELLEALKDPETAAAFESILKDPSNLLKYQGNPKIGPIMKKLMAKFGGMGGMPGGMGGMPGGMGGMPGGMGGMPGGMGGFPGGMGGGNTGSSTDDLD